MSIATETFRPIQGFVGYYEVSNFGNVRSIDRNVNDCDGRSKFIKGVNLSPSFNKKTGYKMVSLYKNGKSKTFLVHRLVAQEFPEICGNLFNGCEIDHIDTYRTNNNATNLRVCTRKENHLNPLTRINYKRCANHFKNQIPWNKGIKMPEKSGANHFNAKCVCQFGLNNEFIKKYDTIAMASKTTGIIRTAIDNCLNGRSKTAGNYKWEYAEEVI